MLRREKHFAPFHMLIIAKISLQYAPVPNI